jgi:hypothetical protein
MRTLPKDEARRIGAELRRWSQRPRRETNARALGLCAVIVTMMLVAAQDIPDPAATIYGLALLFLLIQGSVHFMSLGLLRGLLRAGIGEARDAIDSMRDPRRISNFDMAVLWGLIALTAHHFE